jgi:site-specific recombinase XerD
VEECSIVSETGEGKGRKDRMLMLDRDLMPYVSSWLDSGCGRTFLFQGYTPGKAISRRTIEKVYTNPCRKLRINHQGGIHSLRRSFATHRLEQGVDLRYTRELPGHASSRTTEIYTHIAAKDLLKIPSPLDVAPESSKDPRRDTPTSDGYEPNRWHPKRKRERP